MRRFNLLGTLGAIVMMASVQPASAQTSIRDLIEGYIKPGDQFPELVLPDLQTGEPNSITRYRGKKVLLHVFASW